MSITSSIPKLVSTKILRTLENNLVGKQICNMEPDAPIKQVGDTVYFAGLNDPTVSAYTGSISYEDLEDGAVALLIDQQNHYAFKVNDVDAFQSAIDLKGSQTDRAGYELRNACDQYILGLHGGAKNAFSATVTNSNILSTTSKMARILKENNVMEGWIVVPPWYEELLELAGVQFQINEGMDGKMGGIKWASYRNLTIMCSNNVPTTGSEGSYVSEIMAGSSNALIFAEQLLKDRFIPELENSFAGGASGLHVFGARVLKPAELVHLTATQGAVSGI